MARRLCCAHEAGSGGWFWYIPLENDITSVGIVADPEYLLKDRGQDLAKIFHEEIEKCEPCRRRVAEGTRVDKIYSILDYSYRSKHNAGNGFIFIGDAYGFLDPIYSSGVLLALKMAELAADAIHDAFNHDDFSAARLGQYQAKLDRGIESMRKLVYAFYNDGFSFAGFLQKYPEERVHIINLLIGDVFKEGVDRSMGQCRSSQRFRHRFTSNSTAPWFRKCRPLRKQIYCCRRNINTTTISHRFTRMQQIKTVLLRSVVMRVYPRLKTTASIQTEYAADRAPNVIRPNVGEPRKLSGKLKFG